MSGKGSGSITVNKRLSLRSSICLDAPYTCLAASRRRDCALTHVRHVDGVNKVVIGMRHVSLL